MVGIDFLKFLHVASVGLPLVSMDGSECGRRWSGFLEAKWPTQGIVVDGLITVDLGWPMAGLGWYG